MKQGKFYSKKEIVLLVLCTVVVSLTVFFCVEASLGYHMHKDFYYKDGVGAYIDSRNNSICLYMASSNNYYKSCVPFSEIDGYEPK